MLRGLRRSGILIPFIILFIALAISSKPFATKVNLLNLLDQQSALLVIACAGTLVFVAGGLDLSVGAVYALSAVVAARLAQHGDIGLALLVGVLVGVLVGLLNGVIVAIFEINPLIATLSMSFVVSGIASLITSGDSITLYHRSAYGDLARTQIFSVTSATWLTLLVACLLGAALWATSFGRHIYAVGGNINAARLAGLRVTQIRVATFAISGGAAAFGGLIDSSRVLSAQATNGGDTLTFTVIAGIVVGGTSMLGGEGAVWRSVLGILFLALIGNGYNLLGLDPLYQQVTLGVLILLAVAVEGFGRIAERWNIRSWRRRPAPQVAT
ncbi:MULTISPECIES: ABC transporter permease [unclassified Pseudofrankia]|uniref:ABC transporter permease n=1 Tax=unclassified Pseudofrankia TaxID=2994372 RepID=UPI0008D91390|nr:MULTISPECIES: ABC transporter permease [unclassified Pseudofrankia]MDT3444533.1 ABC transporter permease [Pseudofrankia sp. BMG5.37]OHV56406.1 ABC transporter permease [Pseudofrankia sp. BMG5.36]